MANKSATILIVSWVILTCVFAVAMDFGAWQSARGVSAQETQESMTRVYGFLWGFSELPAMTPLEQSHMGDVRSVFLWLEAAWLVLSLLLVIICISATEVLRLYARSSGISLLIMVGIGAIIPFEVLFRGMHLVFFPQGNWQFPLDSVLITLFPGSFFGALGFRIALYLLIAGLALMSIGKRAP